MFGIGIVAEDIDEIDDERDDDDFLECSGVGDNGDAKELFLKFDDPVDGLLIVFVSCVNAKSMEVLRFSCWSAELTCP